MYVLVYILHLHVFMSTINICRWTSTSLLSSKVVLPAAQGVQEGPKPGSVPMIALIEPSWLRYDSVDDDSEPEQVPTSFIDLVCAFIYL